MSLLAQRREFIIAYRKTGSIEGAAAKLNVDPSIHNEWMKDWLYRGAFAEVTAEMKREAKRIADGLPPPTPAVPRRPPGRPRKQPPAEPPPKRPMGRPPKHPRPAVPTIPSGSPGKPARVAVQADVPPPPAAAPVEAPQPARPEGVIQPSVRGYTRLYVKEDEPPAAPPEPEKKLAKAQEDPAEAPLDITLKSDTEQRALIDEYGELDRRMQLRATDTARYESLKRAIKIWFDGVPPDADGSVQGAVYLLHLSARERERKIRSMRELADLIGIDKVLELATVPIGQLEDLMGKARVAALTVETRSGSRRIKAIPKRPAAIATEAIEPAPSVIAHGPR